MGKYLVEVLAHDAGRVPGEVRERVAARARVVVLGEVELRADTALRLELRAPWQKNRQCLGEQAPARRDARRTMFGGFHAAMSWTSLVWPRR